jgi:hypothetical protein
MPAQRIVDFMLDASIIAAVDAGTDRWRNSTPWCCDGTCGRPSRKT